MNPPVSSSKTKQNKNQKPKKIENKNHKNHPAAPVNSLQQFRIIANDIGTHASLAVTITSPSGSRLKAHIINTAEGFLVNFTPTQIGQYLLFVTIGGTPLLTEPYRLSCLLESDPNKVYATGPGLSHGQVHEAAEFVIDTRAAGQGGLGVTVEGPCECHLNCRDNGDGTCNIAYFPTEVGDYTVNITFNEKHIPGSPFQPIIQSAPNLKKIKVSGVGIQPHGKLHCSSCSKIKKRHKQNNDVATCSCVDLHFSNYPKEPNKQ